jgi:hypothetical protein
LKPVNHEKLTDIKERLPVPELQFNKAKYVLLAAGVGGPRYLLIQILRRLYRKSTFIGLVKHLGEADTEIKSKIDYSLNPASVEDINELPQLLKNEGPESIFDLLQRMWFYDSGFHNCYVARTIPGNDLCYMQWTISRQDGNAHTRLFASSFPRLKEGEMQLEHAYTFKRFRGNRLMPAVMNQLFQIARRKNLKRVITYVLEDNAASLKGCSSVGFKKFEIVSQTKIPFFNRYKIIPAADYLPDLNCNYE